MIPAQRNRLFLKLFASHAETRIKGAFSIRARGVDEARALAVAAPSVVIANHTAWWDALVALYVAERLFHVNAYAMMEAKNLRAFPFFARVGAFGVDLESAADGARAIRYSVKLLRGEKALVWLFPQGREVPITAKALDFRGGVETILRLAPDAAAIPLALRYEFGAAEKPTLWMSFGDQVVDRSRGILAYEDAVRHEMSVIDRAIVDHETAEFTVFHEDKTGTGFSAAQKMLSLLVGPRHLE
jgi:hypothetical protein